MIRKLLFGWWLGNLTLEISTPPPESIPLCRGDRVIIHHPISLLDRCLLKIRGVDLEIS